jgi:hypothetical protein
MLNRTRTNPLISLRRDCTINDCLLGATSLLKDDVCDATGKFLGEIEEIILDARTGCVRYAVLALGGFLGIGRKRFPVPWHALTPDTKHRRCVVDVVLMQLVGVPVPRDDPWLQQADQTRSKEERPPAVAARHLGRDPAKTQVGVPKAEFGQTGGDRLLRA